MRFGLPQFRGTFQTHWRGSTLLSTLIVYSTYYWLMKYAALLHIETMVHIINNNNQLISNLRFQNKVSAIHIQYSVASSCGQGLCSTKPATAKPVINK